MSWLSPLSTCIAGDEVPWSATQVATELARVRARVVGCVRRLCRDLDAAEDAVSQATVRLHEGCRDATLRFSATPPLVRWLIVTASNFARDEAKKRQKIDVAPVSLHRQLAAAAEESLFQAVLVHPEEAMVARDIAKLLNLIPLTDREPLLAVVFAAADEPVCGARRSQLARVRRRVRPIFEKEGLLPATSQRRPAQARRRVQVTFAK